MNRLVVIVLIGLGLAGCEKETEMFPLEPGGGGGAGGSMRPDAAIDASDGGGPIAARVCLITTAVHTLSSCATTGAAGFAVMLESETATTGDDGSFTIARPTNAATAVWRISGNGVIASAIKLGAITTLPVIESVIYQDMITAMQPNLADGDGAVILRATRAGGAVTGATVTATPPPQQIYYDGVSELAWDTDATSTYGVAWLPSIAPGTAQFTIMSGATATVSPGQPVFADTITFVFAEIP